MNNVANNANATVAATAKGMRLSIFAFLVVIAAVYHEIIADMVRQWSSDPNYSHGFLVPLVSAYFAWERRDNILGAEVRPEPLLGMIVFLLGLSVLIAATTAVEYFTMRSSIVIVLCGATLYVFGRQAFRRASLPLLYLFLMVPLPYILYDAIAFPLKLLVAEYSVLSMKMMGIAVLRDGNIIVLPQTVLEVADACSGLRSLMSLVTLAVATAVITFKGPVPRVALIAASVPIAMVTNLLRVVVTGWLASRYGGAIAEGFFHESAGLAVFGLAIVFLFATAFAMKKVLE